MKALVAGVAWAAGKGVAASGPAALWVNGLLMASEKGVGWNQMVPFALQMEQQRLQVRAQAAAASVSQCPTVPA